VQPLGAWLRAVPDEGRRFLLSLAGEAQPAAAALAGSPAVRVLSGPEGGLSPAEEEAARSAGFQPISLGARILRAETAPLAFLALATLTS
jgi:16S rRNA (uracil1498-N3)-methyltransferase